LSKVKEIKRSCGGVVYYAAQARAQIDAEIGQKRPFEDGNYLTIKNHNKVIYVQIIRTIRPKSSNVGVTTDICVASDFKTRQ
jgi:hypothetical protein